MENQINIIDTVQSISVNFENMTNDKVFMKQTFTEFENILKLEDSILDQLSDKQALLRASVTEKNWEKLTDVVSQINSVSDSFMEVDKKREDIKTNYQLKIYDLILTSWANSEQNC